MRRLTESFFVAAPARVLGKVGAGGFAGGAVLTVTFLVLGSPLAQASATAFSLGTLLFGFGLATWATALWIGRPLRALFARRGSSWNRENAARAFSIVTVLGVGGMLGSVAATLLLGAVLG